ncbi:hypothetical protein EDC90_103823 [Martelella mediterranea]|uniref:Uncharacterized protein n=1 Tax=Martelella mediterranea TaxID=293089 RepID=A0A4V2V3F5_9HYPH|nr:hypothetical protein EDC90_103823 [Martelella mediterranea]
MRGEVLKRVLSPQLAVSGRPARLTYCGHRAVVVPPEVLSGQPIRSRAGSIRSYGVKDVSGYPVIAEQTVLDRWAGLSCVLKRRSCAAEVQLVICEGAGADMEKGIRSGQTSGYGCLPI